MKKKTSSKAVEMLSSLKPSGSRPSVSEGASSGLKKPLSGKLMGLFGKKK